RQPRQRQVEERRQEQQGPERRQPGRPRRRPLRRWRPRLHQPGRLQGSGQLTGYDDIIERLQSIEEELRDLAYDRLRDALDSPDVLTEERRIHQARRAIEKAIRLLGADRDDADADPDCALSAPLEPGAPRSHRRPTAAATPTRLR